MGDGGENEECLFPSDKSQFAECRGQQGGGKHVLIQNKGR